MLGKASVVRTRNQVKGVPVHQGRVFYMLTFLLFMLQIRYDFHILTSYNIRNKSVCFSFFGLSQDL